MKMPLKISLLGGFLTLGGCSSQPTTLSCGAVLTVNGVKESMGATAPDCELSDGYSFVPRTYDGNLHMMLTSAPYTIQFQLASRDGAIKPAQTSGSVATAGSAVWWTNDVAWPIKGSWLQSNDDCKAFNFSSTDEEKYISGTVYFSR